jgi:hypothetical protein
MNVSIEEMQRKVLQPNHVDQTMIQYKVYPIMLEKKMIGLSSVVRINKKISKERKSK